MVETRKYLLIEKLRHRSLSGHDKIIYSKLHFEYPHVKTIILIQCWTFFIV